MQAGFLFLTIWKDLVKRRSCVQHSVAATDAMCLGLRRRRAARWLVHHAVHDRLAIIGGIPTLYKLTRAWLGSIAGLMMLIAAIAPVHALSQTGPTPQSDSPTVLPPVPAG